MEELWWKRLNDFQAQKPVLSAADMSNRKTNESLHNNKTVAELLELFTAERQKLLETIYYFDEDLLQRIRLTSTAKHAYESYRFLIFCS